MCNCLKTHTPLVEGLQEVRGHGFSYTSQHRSAVTSTWAKQPALSGI